MLQTAYLGHRYYCNCCHSWVRKLCPGGSLEPVVRQLSIIGAGFREADYCPVCKATSRDRLVWLYLRPETENRNFKRILHIAPERQLSLLLRKSGDVDYRCGDIDPDRYRYYAPAEYIDLCAIQYEENYFDLVVCNHVLEHIPDDRKAMQELVRVLKPGGTAILQVPVSAVLEETYEDPSLTSESQRLKAYGQKDHVRIYGKDYAERLGQAGFDVCTLPSAGFSLDGRMKKIAIDEQESLFVCTKKTGE